jgi:hypothetical protein
MSTTSEITYPLPVPKQYEEPSASRGLFITLRPQPSTPFTNESEEKNKIIDYSRKISGFKYVIIGKESNEIPNYATNSPNEEFDSDLTIEKHNYHYHVLIKTSNAQKDTRKKTIQKEIKSLFPTNLTTTHSIHVRFMDPKTRNAIAYTCKQGNYTFHGDITQEFIDNTLKIYMKELNRKPDGTKRYKVCKKIGEVFNVLLEFCLDEKIKHCNYTQPQTDKRGQTTCDNVELFVFENKEFKDIKYLIKYFMDTTGNLTDSDTDKIEKLAKYALFRVEKFEQTVVTNRYVAFDNGNILIDGQNAKILTLEEATEVLNTYTPLRTYEENPRDDPQYPSLFYGLLEQTQMADEVMTLLRYYIAGENNKSILSYQMMGESNTGKTTIIDYITNHFGIHAKKLTEEGKFTFAESPNHLLRWSDEINLYQLYRTPTLDKILLAILDRKPTDSPYKHKGQVQIAPGLLLTATNPERDNPKFTAHKNNYDTKVYKPLNNRIKPLRMTHKFPDGKIDHSETISAETPYAVYDIATNTISSDNIEEDQR